MEMTIVLEKRSVTEFRRIRYNGAQHAYFENLGKVEAWMKKNAFYRVVIKPMLALYHATSQPPRQYMTSSSN